MPELPEVETVARGLAKKLTGAAIEKAEVYLDKIVRPDPKSFARNVGGAVITGVGRRGKVILVELDRGLIAVHLKMTGGFVFVPAGQPPARHSHVRLVLRDPAGKVFETHYSDMRQFGWLHYLDPADLDQAEFFSQLGPDALAVGQKEFVGRLAGRRGRLKPLLLNQSFVAGLGNIYADEALHRAGLHPLCPAESLTDEGRRRLHKAVRQVLREAVKLGGSSIANFKDAEGKLGYFQTKHRVYGRSGQPCPACGCRIERIVLGGRAACFCPACQPPVA